MSNTLVMLLGDAPRWLRIANDVVVARGDGAAPVEVDTRVVALLPAQDVVIDTAALPDLSGPQATGAARLFISEQSVSPIDTLHVAVSAASEAGDRTIVAIDRVRMAQRLAEAQLLGGDPDVVMASPLALTAPASGFVRGNLGSETVVRGTHRAFGDDGVLTAMLTGGRVTDLDRASVESGLVRAVQVPEVNLRQGMFAKRRRWGIDWPLVRTIGRLAAGIAVVTLVLQIVQIIRLDHAADRAAAAQVEVATAALPGVPITSPMIQINERLARLRGPGGGIMPLAAAVGAAANAVPNLELTTMVFDGGGTLRVTTRAASASDLAAFERQLASSGLTATPGPVMVDQGRQLRDYTVSPR